MSGRIRTIKPEWLEDERLAFASSDARVLSVSLLLLADDYGNGRANATQLCCSVFPGRVRDGLDNPRDGLENPREALEHALEELATLRFVALYQVDGQHYFHVRNWDKHQKVDRPGKPRVPGYSEEFEIQVSTRESSRRSRESIANPRDSLATDLIPHTSYPIPRNADLERARPPARETCGSTSSDTESHRESNPEPVTVGDSAEAHEPPRHPESPQNPSGAHEAASVPPKGRTRATGTATAPHGASSSVTVGSDQPWRNRAPSSLEEALGWPLRERSQACLQFSHAADWCCPQQWPEVRAVEERFSEVLRRTRVPLGAFSRDSGVRALLGLFADGVELDALLAGLGNAPHDDWLRTGRKGLSSLTIEVYRRLSQPMAPPESRGPTPAEVDARRAEVERRRAEHNAKLDVERKAHQQALVVRAKANGVELPPCPPPGRAQREAIAKLVSSGRRP